jgi:hypothetical protein
MSRCRFAPGTIPRCSIRSQYSRAQKTVEKTVKQLETGGKFQTSVKDNENGVTATAASQGHRASAGGHMGMPQKERGAGLSPAPLIRLWSYYTSVLVNIACVHAEDSDILAGAIISIR